MTQVRELHAQLRDTLARAEIWSKQMAATPYISVASAFSEKLETEIAHLRTRAASALINVAMFGAFSAGKSFLVSGLQGQLEVVEVVDDDGFPAEKFIGLLPSSPQPTSSCPVQIVPVEQDSEFDTSGTGFVRVRFADSSAWENVGNSPAQAVVAAYATAQSDVYNRNKAHWGREVAEVEILLSTFKVPAKLYDLPGYGSPVRVHDTIISNAINDADCFMYVSRANRTLAEEDLELIRELYIHCSTWKKRVIWVLTGIDAATQVDHKNVAAWRTIIAENNRYLEENFVKNGQPDRTFIGDGFIPVSPAAEARASMQATAGQGANERHYQASSQMDSLRQILRDLIEQESGRKHVADIAGAAQNLIGPLANTVSTRLLEERLPIDEIVSLMKAQQASLQLTNEAIPTLRTDLDQSIRDRVARASRSFSNLAGHLHAMLDSSIRDTDIRVSRKSNQIQVFRTQVLQQWLEQPEGPAELWDEQLSNFRRDILGHVRRRLNDNESTDQLHSSNFNAFNMQDLDFSLRRSNKNPRQDIVERAAVIVGISAPVAATATYIVSAVAAGAVFPPAAAIAGAAAAVYLGIKLFKKKASSLEVMQEEWIAELDSLAQSVKMQFELSLGSQCTSMLDQAIDSLESYRTQLEKSIERMRDRIADPGYQMRQEIVDQLEPLSTEGTYIVTTLSDLSALD